MSPEMIERMLSAIEGMKEAHDYHFEHYIDEQYKTNDPSAIPQVYSIKKMVLVCSHCADVKIRVMPAPTALKI